ncbi:MAG TPA: sensory rhodopsin transducer [Candidatus Methylacidiphilales bacterium]|nr:sensory rhodopsin transducer [Candidatus Methylacidiphilales bacterium]
MKTSIGRKIWAIPEGYIPDWGHGPKPELASHEAFCVLNASDDEAQIELTIFYSDRAPAGPYRMTVEANRTRHFRFNELTDPEPIPKGTEYASVFVSSVPVVIQHTRLDSRQAANALMTTIAFPGSE